MRIPRLPLFEFCFSFSHSTAAASHWTIAGERVLAIYQQFLFALPQENQENQPWVGEDDLIGWTRDSKLSEYPYRLRSRNGTKTSCPHSRSERFHPH